MKDLLYTGLKVLIVFIIAVVIINDAGALLMTYFSASDMSQVVADGAVSSYKTSHSPAEARIAAEDIAKDRGLILTDFQMDDRAITVSIEVPAKKTFVVHRIESLEPYLSASSTATADIETRIN